MTRTTIMLGAILASTSCVQSQEPTGFSFGYQLSAYACATSCDVPGDSLISSAARGDTVWLSHLVELVFAIDSTRPQQATLRAACGVNVVVLAGVNTVRSLPAPAICPDSTYEQTFTLAGVVFPRSIDRYTRWIVDSGIPPGTYEVRGGVMVEPRLEPSFTFAIQ
jgi:hypothetical protein